MRTGLLAFLTLALSVSSSLHAGDPVPPPHQVWPGINLKIDPAEWKFFASKDYKTIIQEIRDRGIPVIIFDSLPERARPNPDLLAVPNSPEEEAAKKEFLRLGVTEFDRGSAQYLAPYAHNIRIENKRPYLERGVILLGRGCDRVTILHEYLHSKYQAKFFPKPTKAADGTNIHPYTAEQIRYMNLFDKFAESTNTFEDAREKNAPIDEIEAKMLEVMNKYLLTLEAWPTAELSPTIEEVFVHATTYLATQELKFDQMTEQREALHRLWAQLDEFHDKLDKAVEPNYFETTQMNRGILSKENKRRLSDAERVRNIQLERVRTIYGSILRDLVDLDLGADIDVMEKKGRVKIKREGGVLDLQVL